MTPPIVNALAIVRTALQAALSPLCAPFNSEPACYFKIAKAGTAGALKSGALPALLVFQFQDGGGQGVDYLGSQDWTGLVTIKVIAATHDAADALHAQVPAALAALSVPTGYRIAAAHVRPLDLPATDGLITTASIYRITLTR